MDLALDTDLLILIMNIRSGHMDMSILEISENILKIKLTAVSIGLLKEKDN